MEVIGNIKYVTGVTQYVIDNNDGTINVDTSVNAVTIILPNILNSGYYGTQKGFIINDISNNASVKNITIVAANNTVNSASNVVINVNGGTAKCSIASQTEWFIVREPESAGGVSNANNGLTLSVDTVELGGTLNKSTTIQAGNSTPLIITDSNGVLFQTRDVNNNINWNRINGGAYIDSISDIIASYLSDSGTSFINSRVAIHFGGACSYNSTIYTYNFGDYSTFNGTSLSLNLGRSNSYTNTSSVSIFGNSNTVNSSSGITIIGSGNTVSSLTDRIILGNNNLNMIIDSTGNVGIRTSTPTAKLTIAAGTAAANTAPLKLTSGVNMTTPENGAFEFDGTNLYFTVGGVRKTVTLV